MALSRRAWFKRLLQTAGSVPLLGIWFGKDLSAAPGQTGALLREPSPGFAREKITSAFDWDATAARRPVFTNDYFIGYSSVHVDRRADWAYDLERMCHYSDRVLFRAAAIDPKKVNEWVVSPQLVVLPDLFDDAAVAKWVNDTRRQWEPLLAKIKQYGFGVVALTIYFNLFGRESTPDWYRRSVPDYNEVPAGGDTYEREKKMTEMTCLTHPRLYEVAERYWKAVRQLMDAPIFLATCVDNEPTLHYRMGWRGLGGNPHTRKLFQQFLAERHGDVSLFNRTAGTNYKSFQEVDIGAANWLVRLYAARLRFFLVHGYYMRKLIEGLRRNTRLKAFTRLWPGYNTDISGVDLSYVQDMNPDVISFTFHTYIIDTRKDGEAETDLNYRRDRLGQMAILGGLLRGVGRPLGITEPLFDRGYGLTVPRDYEFLHLVYRGLYYRLGFYNIHSWSRAIPIERPEIKYPIYNYFYGMSHAHRPKLMRMIHQVREELDRISPYQTFGAPVPPPIAILLTRNATHFPGMGGAFYGDVCYRLGKLMEEPEWCLAEVVEEHDRTLTARVKNCRGVIVVGTGFEESTRGLLAGMAQRGVKILWLSPPAHVTSKFAPLEFDAWLPVAGMRSADLTALDQAEAVTWVQFQGARVDAERLAARSETCEVSSEHPLLRNLLDLKLFASTSVEPRARTQSLLRNNRGEAVGAVQGNVAFLAGMPMEPDQQRRLYGNFVRWCGFEPPGVVISQFEHATVVQHFDPRNEDLRGRFQGGAWRGNVPLADGRAAGLWELRRDMPWLAYHREGGQTVVEAVHLELLDVKVFRKEESGEMPHFEHVSPGVGIETFWYDPYHIVAELSVGSSMAVKAKFAPAHWGTKPIRWFVFRQSESLRVAEGREHEIEFSAEPGNKYILGVRYHEGHLDKECTLCNYGWFR